MSLMQSAPLYAGRGQTASSRGCREREGERRYRRTAFGFYLAYWLAFAVSSSSLLRLGLRLVSGYVCDSNSESDTDSKSGVGVGHISGTTCRKNKPADKVTSLGWRCLHSLITAPSERKRKREREGDRERELFVAWENGENVEIQMTTRKEEVKKYCTLMG